MCNKLYDKKSLDEMKDELDKLSKSFLEKIKEDRNQENKLYNINDLECEKLTNCIACIKKQVNVTNVNEFVRVVENSCNEYKSKLEYVAVLTQIFSNLSSEEKNRTFIASLEEVSFLDRKKDYLRNIDEKLGLIEDIYIVDGSGDEILNLREDYVVTRDEINAISKLDKIEGMNNLNKLLDYAENPAKSKSMPSMVHS